MTVAVAGKVISSVAFKGGTELLRKSFNAPDRKVLFETLYYSAQAGNLKNTAKELCAKYPDMAHIIRGFISAKKGVQSSLERLNEAGKAFRATREAHPVKIDTII